MGALELFATSYLTEIIDERDSDRRRAAIGRLIHPTICHVGFNKAVYGLRAFEERIEEMTAPWTTGVEAGLRGRPHVEANMILVRWRVADDSTTALASGGIFVVLSGSRAEWMYAA